ncbi:hypothetical protein FHS89_001833 [Rubricella aquisinus]|uniref:Peptidoglycan binding-like domain-containing protein n=1 Tax=Rubricella aquisinus TaxID=2028108 RepID=A0A840WP04_9RHOB|nr:peptidoglycan-binding domain-containing protein [Rubricella aquisinus]MBB5515813.1 hypothetical protein [Rubricella aquisinus]
MQIKTILMASVCAGVLVGCGDYVLPERDNLNQSELVRAQPHPDASRPIDDLNALIEQQNAARQERGLDPLTTDQAVSVIVSAQRTSSRAAERPGFFSTLLANVQADQTVGAVNQQDIAAAAAALAAAQGTLNADGTITRPTAAVATGPNAALAAVTGTPQNEAATAAAAAAAASTPASAPAAPINVGGGDASIAAAAAAAASALANTRAAAAAPTGTGFAVGVTPQTPELDVRVAVTDDTIGPPDPVPGQCYAQVTEPPQFETVQERVVDVPPTQTFEVIPATTRTEEIPVVVEEAYTEFRVIPPVYETIMETVIVEPARERTVTVPAEFRTVVERRPVRPAFRSWRDCNRVFPVGSEALGGTFLGNRVTADGGLQCLIEFPAEFETITREELVAPETTRVETIPAVTKQVPRRVVVQPARTEEVVVPARIETVEREVIDTPERIEATTLPARFRTVERRVEVRPERVVWSNVVCDTDQTGTLIANVQRSLRERGLYTGEIDGINGPGTRAAIRAYQLENGLDSSILTIETARILGARS